VLGVGEKSPHFSLVANTITDEHSAFRTVTDQGFLGASVKLERMQRYFNLVL